MKLFEIVLILLLLSTEAFAQTGQFPDMDGQFYKDNWQVYSADILKDSFRNNPGALDLIRKISFLVVDDRDIGSDEYQIAGSGVKGSDENLQLTIHFGLRFVKSIGGPDQFRAFLIHEFGHLILFKLYLNIFDDSPWQLVYQREFGPDMITAVVQPGGACELEKLIGSFKIYSGIEVNRARKSILANICSDSLLPKNGVGEEKEFIRPEVPDKESTDAEKIQYYRSLLLWAYPGHSRIINEIKIELISDYLEIYACPFRRRTCSDNIIYIPRNFFSLYSGKPEHIAPVLGHELGHLLFDRDYRADFRPDLVPYAKEPENLQFRVGQEMQADLFAIFAGKSEACGLMNAVLAGLSKARIYSDSDNIQYSQRINSYRFKYLNILCR